MATYPPNRPRSGADPGAADTAAMQTRTALSAGRPVPLGLIAFGIPTFTFGSVMAGWWPHPLVQTAALVPLFLVFGGIVQFIVAMWAYRTGETLAATFFGAFGGLFGTLGIYALATGSVLRSGIPAQALVATLGPMAVVAACFCFVALFVAAGAMLPSPGLGITSLALAVSLFFISWSLFAQGDMLLMAIAGWAAVVSGALALLSAAAVAMGSGIARFRTFGPLGTLAAMTGRVWTQRPTTA
jgi:succinate-acetate transporter protein